MIWIILGITIAVSVGLLAIKDRSKYKLLNELFRDLGIAGIVGCLVAATFELYLHRRSERDFEEKLHKAEKDYNDKLLKAEQDYNARRDQIAKDVYVGAFGVTFDEELRKEIAATVFKTHLIREDLTVSYDLQSATDSVQAESEEKLLDLTVTVFYRVRNTGAETVEHSIAPSFDELPTMNSKVGRFLSLKVEGCIGGPITLSGPNITQSKNEERRIRDLPGSGRIQIARGEAATVEWVYQTRRRHTDKFTWVTVLPARSFTLKAKKGKGLADLEFIPNTAHRIPNPEQVKPKRGEPSPSDGEYIWKIDAAVLPYQGIFLDWYPASKVRKE